MTVPTNSPSVLSGPDEDLIPEPAIDFERLRSYRLGRVREQLAKADVAMAVLTNPLSLQYAVDFEEYQLFQSRIPSFTLLVPPEGPVRVCGAYHPTAPQVDEFLPSLNLSQFDAGLDMIDRAREAAELLTEFLPIRSRIALDRIDPCVTQALMQAGFEVVDAGGLLERARSIKSAEEIALIRHAVAVADLGIQKMRSALVPGIAEQGLFSLLVQENIRHGGRWMDGRMLSSGPRSNPWLQEASGRRIELGDIVAFDTDMVGPFGYFADVSRTLVCGHAPTPTQKDLYRRAYEEVTHNMDLVRPGVGFEELSRKAFRQDDPFIAHRYPCLAHGAGMSDEWPKVAYRQDWDRIGYDGEIEAGMVLCIESFVGHEAGGEGVKLEQQVHVTETGVEVLSDVPFEDAFLG